MTFALRHEIFGALVGLMKFAGIGFADNFSPVIEQAGRERRACDSSPVMLGACGMCLFVSRSERDTQLRLNGCYRSPLMKTVISDFPASGRRAHSLPTFRVLSPRRSGPRILLHCSVTDWDLNFIHRLVYIRPVTYSNRDGSHSSLPHVRTWP